MTISKKTLDEAIKLYKEYWGIETTDICAYVILMKLAQIANDLELQVNKKVSGAEFRNIISVYAHCEATNETIYKAIELLGIKII